MPCVVNKSRIGLEIMSTTHVARHLVQQCLKGARRGAISLVRFRTLRADRQVKRPEPVPQCLFWVKSGKAQDDKCFPVCQSGPPICALMTT